MRRREHDRATCGWWGPSLLLAGVALVVGAGGCHHYHNRWQPAREQLRAADRAAGLMNAAERGLDKAQHRVNNFID